MCKMIVSNEPANYKQYSTLVFVEFLEFVARVSDLKFKSMPDTSLAQKIELFLEELCPAFGLTKQDVNIENDENSESDDDY